MENSFVIHSILILFTAILMTGYIPLNRYLKKGVLWKSWLDDKVPFIDWFVYPYLPLYGLWLVLFFVTLLFRPLIEVLEVFIAMFIVTSIGYSFFYFFPTYVECTFPKGSSFARKFLQRLHVFDRPFNACPSMHVFICMLLFLFSSQWLPEFGLLFLIAASLIIASTVLIKRHYLYDIVGGIVLGFLGYYGSHFIVNNTQIYSFLIRLLELK